MISLFVDASLSYCNLAIIENNKVLRHISIKTNNNLTDLIVEHIDELLNSARLHQKDVKRLLIVIGPGSFTGIRVASTIAKT
jgi:tRNA threonylcarbamoyl adenosine modification protein YeaZ